VIGSEIQYPRKASPMRASADRFSRPSARSIALSSCSGVIFGNFGGSASGARGGFWGAERLDDRFNSVARLAPSGTELLCVLARQQEWCLLVNKVADMVHIHN
jgi:hypothetical protein